MTFIIVAGFVVVYLGIQEDKQKARILQLRKDIESSENAIWYDSESDFAFSIKLIVEKNESHSMRYL